MEFPVAYTPLSGDNVTQFAPIQVAVGTDVNLQANSNVSLFRDDITTGQIVDVEEIEGQSATDVSVEVETTTKEGGQGEVTNRQEYATAAYDTDEFVENAPISTEVLKARAFNRSSSGVDPWTFYLNYTIRNMTVVEKVLRNIPLTKPEEQLRDEFDIGDRNELGVPATLGDVHRPTLEDKIVVDEKETADVISLSGGGVGNGAVLVNERVDDDEVIYLTGIEHNAPSQTAPSDNVNFSIRRGEAENEFYRIKAADVPASTDVFLPFFDRLNVELWSDNTATVDARVEYAVVKRTLVEKALYGFEGEVNAADELGSERRKLYDRIRKKVQAGLPIEPEVKESESVNAAAPRRR